MELSEITCGKCGAGVDAPPADAVARCRHCGATLAPVGGESPLVAQLADEVDALREDLAQLRTPGPNPGAAEEATPGDEERVRLHRAGAAFITSGVAGSLLLYVLLTAWLGSEGATGVIAAVPALLLVVAATGWGVHLVRRAQTIDE